MTELIRLFKVRVDLETGDVTLSVDPISAAVRLGISPDLIQPVPKLIGRIDLSLTFEERDAEVRRLLWHLNREIIGHWRITTTEATAMVKYSSQ